MSGGETYWLGCFAGKSNVALEDLLQQLPLMGASPPPPAAAAGHRMSFISPGGITSSETTLAGEEGSE